ncbi:metallophosphoesterase [Candidatus Pacearchaeota archaeon]|nr:metallophosphoesterase [Candidatus Pacearchaeota archaeon]
MFIIYEQRKQEIFSIHLTGNKMNKEIIKFCAEKGFLVDSDLLELFNETSDVESIKLIIERVKTYTHQNVLTKNLFEKNKEQVSKFFLDLPEENKKNLEKLRIKLGLSIEISKENYIENSKENILGIPAGIEINNGKNSDTEKNNFEKNINILSYTPKNHDKIEVKNFVNYFRKRFDDLREILQERFELDNLLSIDKISGSRQGISIIGMVYNKSITKNKNIILEIEDLTGRIKVLVSKSKEDLYKIAEEICLDSVLGFRCSGNNEVLFANGIFFPDSKIPERKKSSAEEYALFIGDLHFGSKLFLKEGFSKFFDYLNGAFDGQDKDEIKKIKYLFIVGDLVTGVGNYPEQHKDLEIADLEEQFIGLAKFLEKIPEHIKIIISPGNHDGVRLMKCNYY